jgi:hypothetical protein
MKPVNEGDSGVSDAIIGKGNSCMNKFFKIKSGWIVLIYLIADIICAGAGMGVPIFCILLGFLMGWVIIRITLLQTNDLTVILKKSIKYGIVTTLITFLLMVIIWGGAIIAFYHNHYDFKNFGQPLILYDPELSFIGWFVLMIVISPFLQLLTTVFSFYMTLVMLKKNEKQNDPANDLPGSLQH